MSALIEFMTPSGPHFVALYAVERVAPAPEIMAGVQRPASLVYCCGQGAVLVAGDARTLATFIHQLRTGLHPLDQREPILAPIDEHPTDRLVAMFATALKDKLHASANKPGRGHAWLESGWQAECQAELRRHVEKGDPLDVAAYAAFAWFHGWCTGPASTSEAATVAAAVTNVEMARAELAQAEFARRCGDQAGPATLAERL